ncbi:MAG: divalent-cation tolerance protein CutA [Casimicrobiaceae bacterium]
MDDSSAGAAIVVLTNLPDRESAGRLARTLVEGRLAACVSIGATVESIYHWRGKTETAVEVPVSVKTRAALFLQVEAAIRSFHPYELPEIVAVPLTHGSTAYLAWIAAATHAA